MSSHEEDTSAMGGQQPTGPGWGPPPQVYGQPQLYGPLQQYSQVQEYGQPQYFGLQYGQPQQYGQPALGYPPQPVWVPPVPVYPYAAWSRRAGGYLIDFAPSYIAQIPFWIGYVMFSVRLIQPSTAPPTSSADDVFADFTGSALVWMIVGVVLMLAAFGWQWYNRWLIGGRTGQSMGRRMLQTKLVAEANGQPIGAVNAFLRDLLHVLDGAAYIGYLWPLWDAKRQTFADMIMKTVVIDERGWAPAPSAGGAHGHHPKGPA